MAACACTRAAGPLVGFEVGWLLIWTRVLSAAANLNLFVLYLAELWPEAAAGAPRAIVMLVLAGTVAITNVIGVRGAAWAIDADTLAGRVVTDSDWTRRSDHDVCIRPFESALLPRQMRDPKRDVAFALLVGRDRRGRAVLVQLVVVGVVADAAA
jgi:hypothetical protein